VVVGLFGGMGLVATELWSRRGPRIFIPYAALLFVLGLVLTRYAGEPFSTRFVGAMAGFLIASVPLYYTVGRMAALQRVMLVRKGRLPPEALYWRLSVAGHVWRLGVLVVIGAALSAGVAYVAG
jgi:hypothetical protein